jgi:histidinol phosphatase-like enzyme (inositol monophosphatase family)
MSTSFSAGDPAMRPFLAHLASLSSAVIMPHFSDPDLKIELKADQTPVTYADRKAEEVLRAAISRAFPDHGIIGEEFGSDRPDAEYTWVLDPIDGTKTFTAGSPHFGTLICLRRHGMPVWGALHLPALGRLFVGNNETAWCNDRTVRVRHTPRLADCTLLVTDPRTPPQLHSASGWQRLLDATGMYRSWGDCFGYALVAGGTADIMCDPIMNLWDIAALLPIVRGAGAAASAWDGSAPDAADSLVVSHPAHHATILSLLAG